jgi:hypothetical protein
MKTKDRLSVAQDEAGMLLKTQQLLAVGGNVVEKKGG